MGFEPQIKEVSEGPTGLYLTRFADLASLSCSVRHLFHAPCMTASSSSASSSQVMARLPSRHQTLLFSATMPKEIEDLANGYLNNPVTVKVRPLACLRSTRNQVSSADPVVVPDCCLPVAVARLEP